MARANSSFPVPLAPFDQHGAGAVRDLRQDLENLPHGCAAADDFGKAEIGL